MTRAQETQRRAAEMVAEMRRILAAQGKKIRIMEVCGTHTVAIFRAGLRQILPEGVELVAHDVDDGGVLLRWDPRPPASGRPGRGAS